MPTTLTSAICRLKPWRQKSGCRRSRSSKPCACAPTTTDRELDFKLVAKLAGKKSLEPVAVKELVGLTGYIRGGVTALACKKPYPVFVDELMELCDEVSVSAGQRGLQIVLTPADYIRAVDAVVGPISRAAV